MNVQVLKLRVGLNGLFHLFLLWVPESTNWPFLQSSHSENWRHKYRKRQSDLVKQNYPIVTNKYISIMNATIRFQAWSSVTATFPQWHYKTDLRFSVI